MLTVFVAALALALSDPPPVADAALPPPIAADADRDDSSIFGRELSRDALFLASSTSPWDEPERHMALVGEGHEPFAFHTADEERPWVRLDLGSVRPITGLSIVNRTDGNGVRTTALVVAISTDGAAWNEIGTLAGPLPRWSASIRTADGRPREARFVRLMLPAKGMLHLSRVQVFGPGGGAS
jgi:hypothetical protein